MANWTQRIPGTDRVRAIALGFLVALVTGPIFGKGLVAQEDAAILFRYSENVANGFGIVYNPGGEKVDGATDLPFMWVLAFFNQLGVSTTVAAVAVSAISTGVVAALIYLAWCKWSGLGGFWALLPVAFLMAGPVWAYGMAGFGTLFFAASCAALAFAAEMASDRASTRRLLILGALATVCGLARPEGFLLAGAVIAFLSLRLRSWRFLLVPLAVIIPAGMMWVAWRWSYFGYPLPNPFYKKGGGRLYIDGLRASVSNVVRLTYIFMLPVLASLVVRQVRSRAVTICLVVFTWTSIWVLLSNEMNFVGRFQFGIVPVIAIMSAPLIPALRKSVVEASWTWLPNEKAVSIAVLVTLLLLLGWTLRQEAKPSLGRLVTAQANLNFGIHENLSAALAVSGQPGKVAVSEAGYVAWKSGWVTTDLWGLNDKQIAHEGFLSEQQLLELRPEVVFTHLCYDNGPKFSAIGEAPCIQGWSEMTDPLVCFVSSQKYRTAGYWVDSRNHAWAVFVDSQSKRAKSLTQAISAIDAGADPIQGERRINVAGKVPIPQPPSCAKV